MLNSIKTQGVLERHRIQPPGPGAPVHRARRPPRSARPGTWASTTSSSAPTAATARSWPSAFPPSRSWTRRRADEDHEGLPGRRDAYGVVEKHRHRRRRQGPGRELPALRHPGRNLRPRKRLQQGPGRLHARLLHRPSASMPNNAIVGGSADISRRRRPVQANQPQAGHRHRQHRRRLHGLRPGLGRPDAWPPWTSTASCGTRTSAAAPPILFNFFNNFYGMGGQTCGETMGYKILARVGAGVNPDNMHAERVDGYNPLAVADAIERKKEILLAGKGPVLLDTITYRLSGHSPSDASSYRTREELELWRTGRLRRDLRRLPRGERRLVRRGHGPNARRSVVKKITDDHPPGLLVGNLPALGDPDFIETVMFSNRQVREDGRPGAGNPDGRSRTIRASRPLTNKAATALTTYGKPVSKNKAIRRCATRCSRPCCTGFTMIRPWSPTARRTGTGAAPSPCYRGLTEALPYHRLFNTPISEGAIVGTGVGYAVERRPGGGGADVLRLHGPGRRRDFQPGRQVAVHVGRHAENAARRCACRWAPSTAPSTRRTGRPWSRTFPGSKSSSRPRPTTPRACSTWP